MNDKTVIFYYFFLHNTRFFFYKNKLYKNVHDENGQKIAQKGMVLLYREGFFYFVIYLKLSHRSKAENIDERQNGNFLLFFSTQYTLLFL